MVRNRFGGIICQPRWEDNGAGGDKGGPGRMVVLRADTQHARSTATSWEQIVVGTFLHALRADIQHACSWRNSRRALRADSVRSAVDGWLRACCLMFLIIETHKKHVCGEMFNRFASWQMFLTSPGMGMEGRPFEILLALCQTNMFSSNNFLGMAQTNFVSSVQITKHGLKN